MIETDKLTHKEGVVMRYETKVKKYARYLGNLNLFSGNGSIYRLGGVFRMIVTDWFAVWVLGMTLGGVVFVIQCAISIIKARQADTKNYKKVK